LALSTVRSLTVLSRTPSNSAKYFELKQSDSGFFSLEGSTVSTGVVSAASTWLIYGVRDTNYVSKILRKEGMATDRTSLRLGMRVIADFLLFVVEVVEAVEVEPELEAVVVVEAGPQQSPMF
jgi:hypothetical protein